MGARVRARFTGTDSSRSTESGSGSGNGSGSRSRCGSGGGGGGGGRGSSESSSESGLEDCGHVIRTSAYFLLPYRDKRIQYGYVIRTRVRVCERNGARVRGGIG